MSSTSQFGLPLIAAAQAQKHVTVNEALARLDAVAQLRLQSLSTTVPPLSVADGVAYGVPAGAVNAWDTHAGEVAIFANGGWVFLTPKAGWRAWVVDQLETQVFDGVAWQGGVRVMSPSGAKTVEFITEFDHVLTAGASNSTTGVIGNGQQVIGVSMRVLSAITGAALVDWSLGIAGNPTQFGAALGLTQGTVSAVPLYYPQTFWGSTPLTLTAGGGTFGGGTVRLAIHGLRLEPPGG